MKQYQIEERGSEYVLRIGVVVEIPDMGRFRAVVSGHKLASKVPMLETADSLHASKTFGPGLWHDTIRSAIESERAAIIARHERAIANLESLAPEGDK